MLSKYEGSFRMLTYEWTDIRADSSKYVQMEYV